MKISSASKKVLASALSAAMVVAFAPTVAFGAQDTNKINVKYDLAGGVDAAAGTQAATVSSDTYTVASDKITLQSGSKVVLASGDNPATSAIEGYAFDHWAITYDADGDGVIESADGDFEDATTSSSTDLTVSDAKYFANMTVTAKAVYKAATLTDVSAAIDNASSKLTFTANKTAGDVLGTGSKYVLTAPSGATSEKATNGTTAVALDAVNAEVGTWSVALVDGNGVTLDTQKVYIGSVTLTGGAFKSFDWAASTNEKYVTSKTYWYVSDGSKANAAAVYGADQAYKIKADGTVDATKASDGFYTAAGVEGANAKIKAGEKGAVATELTASFADDTVAIQNFSYDKSSKKLNLLFAGVPTAESGFVASDVKDPAKAEHNGYYVALTNAEGKVVAESVAVNTGATAVTLAKAMSFGNLEAGTYTATLYKVTKKADATDTTDGTPGKIETVATATAEVADDYAAAPTWSYEAKYNTDGTANGGLLTVTNNAGEGYEITVDGVKYETTKGALAVAAQGTQLTKTLKAANAKATEKKESKVVTLIGYHDALDAFNGVSSSFGVQTINGKVGSYYADNADVKAAIKAAKKTFTDKGFVEQAKTGDSAAKTWASVTIAAEQSVVDAVVEVAKAQLEPYKTGVKSADGTKVSILAGADYDAAIAGIEAASKAYAANHDGVDGNNVTKVNKVDVAALKDYVKAADAGIAAGIAKATTYAVADVEAAAAVDAQINKLAADYAEVTKDNYLAAADAAVEAQAAYAALNKAQQALVTADTQIIVNVLSDAATIADQVKDEEAKKAAEEAAKKLADAQDQAAANLLYSKTVTAKAKVGKKAQGKSFTYKLAASESGATATYSKASGSKYIKVSASGKVTFSKVKVAKKAKTYKAKVTVTYGTKTCTKTVTYKVKKK